MEDKSMSATQTQLNGKDRLAARITKYWDKRSAAFGKVRRMEMQGSDGAAWLKLLKEHLPEGRSLKILDVGTGAGFFALILAGEGHEVIGIDVSSQMLSKAKENMAITGFCADFRLMSAQELEFEPETFDAIVSRNLTWTLPDAAAAYKDWRRVLKTGGALMNFDSDLREVTFTKKEDASDVHAGISANMIDECNDIKNSMSINKYKRPDWDERVLSSLGFRVETVADIRNLVRTDAAMKYDDIPLFAIYARKL